MLGKGSLQITLHSVHLLLPHHAVASSKGKAPAWAGAAAKYRTRRVLVALAGPPPAARWGDSGIHGCPRAVLRPMRGRDQSAAPKGSTPRGANARRSLHKPLPYLSLSPASRRQAQCVPRAPCLPGPGHERPKPKSSQSKDCTIGPSAYCTCSFLIVARTHQTSHLGS